jgi:hypothetical protein
VLLVVKSLETLLPGWSFAAVDARGRSGGLATGWRKRSCKVESVWGFVSGIGLIISSTDLGRNLTIINIYGPHQDHQIYWNSLAECDWFQGKDFLLGGDLNFSLGASEVWGPRAAPDPLNNFFLNFLEQEGLMDVEPQKLSPTWCNRRVGLERVAKCLDRFLLTEDLLESSDLVRQWVTYGGESDHLPILIEFRAKNRRVVSPFKFFEGWLNDPTFLDLVRELWVNIPEDSQFPAAVLFVENLKRLKQATKGWAREKKLKEDKEVIDIDSKLAELHDGEGQGFLNQETKEQLFGLEKRRRAILAEREAQWRLKSRALWLACGDENTKFFQAFSKGRKMTNTIWSLRNQRGEEVKNHNELAKLGTEHFKELYSAQEETSIAEIIKVARLFPRFIDEDEAKPLSASGHRQRTDRSVTLFSKRKESGP